MCIEDAKVALRRHARARRRGIASVAGPKAAKRLADNLTARFSSLKGQVVAGYLPIGTEIDVVPAIRLLGQFKLITALPVIVAKGRPLIFRLWTNETELEAGLFETYHPPANSPEIMPDVIIVPMLAFDFDGYRIGWGGGFYDRTLTKLRAIKPITAVGVAFSDQQVDKVPRDQHDARLDLIATEIGITKIAPS